MINKICYLILGIIAVIWIPKIGGHSFLYNNTESIPKGLYWGSEFKKNKSLNIGDIACFRYSAPDWAADRAYFPDNFTLCKKVMGAEGDLVINSPDGYSIVHNNKSISLIIKESKIDSKGRSTVSANLAGVVPNNSVVLIGTGSSKSMDSRFLGFIDKHKITYTAIPLITF